MRTISILLVTIFFSCTTDRISECNYITDYYPNSAKAELEYYLGNYNKAFEYYQDAFENCEAIRLSTHYDTDRFAKVCAELGKDELAMDYIEKTIEKGGTLNGFQNDKAFNDIFNTDRGKKLIADYESKHREYLNSLNMDLRFELQAMMEIDQRLVRQPKKRDSVFKVNDKRLVEIFEKYGYPNEQVVGNYRIDQTWAEPGILLLHTDDSIRINYFIPKIKEFIKEGHCAPSILGALCDNLALYNGEPQTHGTYKDQSGKYSEMISDITKVNSNRAEVGLPSLMLTEKIDSLKSL